VTIKKIVAQHKNVAHKANYGGKGKERDNKNTHTKYCSSYITKPDRLPSLGLCAHVIDESMLTLKGARRLGE
jgi:hypothetical protein